MNYRKQTFLLRATAGLLVLILLLTTLQPPIIVHGAEPYQTMAEEEGYRITFSLDSRWENGGNGTVTIENTGSTAIKGWILTFDWEGTITSCWNASMEKSDENSYIFKHDGWNSTIPTGQSVSIGFSAELAEDTPLPEQFLLPVAVQPVVAAGYTVSYQCSSDWGSGFEGTITIHNTGTAAYENWILAFDFSRELGMVWEGKLLSHEGEHYVIGNMGYDGTIPAGGSVTFGFNGTGGESGQEPQNFQLTNTALVTETSETPEEEPSQDEPTDEDLEEDPTEEEQPIDDLTEEEQLLADLRSQGYDSIAAADRDLLSIGYQIGDDATQVSSDLSLPLIGTYGSVITWTSSRPEIISSEGTVVRPDTGTSVVLTATVDDGTVLLAKDFTLQVSPRPEGTVVPEPPVEDLRTLNGGNFPLIYYNHDKQAAYYIEGCYTGMKVTTAAEAVTSLQTINWLLGLGPEDEYRPQNVLTYSWGTVYRLGQYYQGVPLDGNEIIVMVDSAGRVTALNSSHEPNLSLETVAAVSGQAATETAIAYAGGGELIDCELLIVRHEGEYRLSWMVTLDYIETESYPTVAAFLVDAQAGTVLKSIDGRTGAVSPAMISGKPIEKSAAAAAVDSNGEITVNGTYDDKKDTYYFRDTVRNITIRDGKAERDFFKDKTVVSVDGNNENVFNKFSIEQNALTALYHISQVYDFYLATWGHKSFDRKGGEITIYINSDKDTGWNLFNHKMDIGSYQHDEDSDAKGLDVIAHEYTHAVFQSYAGISAGDSLDYLYPAMEAYSDIIGCMIEQVSNKEAEDQGDGKWLLGEDVLDGGIRNLMAPGSMANPNNYRPYPSSVGEAGAWITKEEQATVEDYIHHNSTPVSHAAYLMSDTVGDPVELATLWYESIGMLQLVREYDNPINPQITDFTAVSRAVMLAAIARNYSEAQKEDIKAAFAQVGIDLLIDGTAILTEEDMKDIDGAVLWVPLPHHTIPGIGTHVFVSTSKEGDYVMAWVAEEPFWLNTAKSIVVDQFGSHYYDDVQITNSAMTLYALEPDGKTWKYYASYPKGEKNYSGRFHPPEWDTLLLYTIGVVNDDPKGAAQRGLTGHNGGTVSLFGKQTLMFY